ncbi:MAG: hypothetical protein JO127_10445 [Caulobacteraceae bacterium]|nr:hypothetical protein [Caulobacteraceae bacterium]
MSAARRPARGAPRADQDVTAAQAFIYRYERASGGLDPQAANQAWRHPDGFWPPSPPPGRRSEDESLGRMDGPGPADRGRDGDPPADHRGEPHGLGAQDRDAADPPPTGPQPRRFAQRRGEGPPEAGRGQGAYAWSESDEGWEEHESETEGRRWSERAYGASAYLGRDANGYLAWPGKTWPGVAP